VSTRITLPPLPSTLGFAALMAVPAAAVAQSHSVLDLLPVDDRVLERGAEHAGTLSASDFVSPDDAFVEAWALEARAGDRVTIDLTSSDFDAYLYVVGPGLTETLRNDDGAGGCDARIELTALESGSFRVVASTLGERASGTYVLRVSEHAEAPAGHACGEADPNELLTLPPEGRSLAMGVSGTGQLGSLSPAVHDGRPAEAWVLDGSAGERVSIVMESESFDAFLYLVGPGIEGSLSDDDGAGNLNARLDATLPADAPYLVVASTVSRDARGSYSIRVEEPIDVAALPTNGRRISIGETRHDVLTYGDPVVLEGRRGQVWQLDGSAGQHITIDLVSSEFDAYLYLVGPGIDEPLFDDDGAGNLDARISATLPADGSYRIIASALDDVQTGSFTLRVDGR
jgi:hypothetical protein